MNNYWIKIHHCVDKSMQMMQLAVKVSTDECVQLPVINALQDPESTRILGENDRAITN